MESVKVAIRVRPLNSREKNICTQSIIEIEGKKTRIINSKVKDAKQFVQAARETYRDFTFDHSYGSDPQDDNFATQEQVFKDFGQDVVNNAFAGYNACIFAYGQTGSGKTHTMMGTPEDPGLIPRICSDIFSRMNHGKKEGTTYRIKVSYLEIYNKLVKDLLQENQTDSLKVREHNKHGIYVDGLSQHSVMDYGDIHDIMKKGNKKRTTASTNMNDVSSRSHAIFTITFTKAHLIGDKQSQTVSKINLVDLAGSERAAKTGADDERLKESGQINKSLSTLASVISGLANAAKPKSKTPGHIPYRNSLLTWLLKDSLGGNSKTFMIATISPADDNYWETLSTLEYANTAKKIINKPTINEDSDVKRTSPGLEFNHCTILLSEGIATLTPSDGTICIVNGLQVDKPTRLSHGYKIGLGSNTYFSYKNPAEAEKLRMKGSSHLNSSRSSSDVPSSSENIGEHLSAAGEENHQLEEKRKRPEAEEVQMERQELLSQNCQNDEGDEDPNSSWYHPCPSICDQNSGENDDRSKINGKTVAEVSVNGADELESKPSGRENYLGETSEKDTIPKESNEYAPETVQRDKPIPRTQSEEPAKKYPEVEEAPGSSISLKIVVVGDSETGKTCLIHQFANHHFTLCQRATVGCDMVFKSVKVGGKVVDLKIWDTAGQEKFFSITNMYMRGADGVFIVYDVVNTSSLVNVTKWFDFVRKTVRENVPIILLGNKADLKTPEVSTKKGKAIADNWGISYLETSAKENDNIEAAFKLLAIEALQNMEKPKAKAEKPAITLNPAASQHKRRTICC